MFRLAGMGVLGFLLIALWIYCIFDVIASEEVLVRNLPKFVWLGIVFFLPDIGSLAWLALGRPLYAGWRPGDNGSRPSAQRRYVPPEDRSDFARKPGEPADAKKLEEWEADLQRREEEFKRRRRDEGTGPQGKPGAW